MLILLVEDDPSEARLTREALAQTGLEHELCAVSDGEKATQYLRREIGYENAQTPELILLDLNLPRKHGREVLREIKADPVLCRIPVIVISNAVSPEDVDNVYRLNGNCYLVKPHDLDELFALIRTLVDFWIRKACLPVVTVRQVKPLAA